MKTCKQCHALRPIEDFYTRSDGAVHSPCRYCQRARRRAYRLANPARIKAKKARERGRGHMIVDEARHAALVAVGVCELCGTTESLGIDHSHSSGTMRGLLCRTCNLGLGYFRDDPGALRAAADYLERREGRP